MKKAKIGLALGAGAARGMAHIGVLQVLEEEGIPIDVMAGASIGSMIGAFYAAGTDLCILGKLADQLQWKHLIDFNISRNGLINGNELSNLIKLLTRNMTFSQLKIPFVVVAADIHNGEEVLIQDGIVAEAVRASIAVPGVFTPVTINGRLLIDGGVVGRVPVSAVKKLGADIVIGVDVGVDLTANRVNNVFEIILQTISIMDCEIAKLKAPEADLIIKPAVGDVALTALHRSQECIELGRKAAQDALPQIKELLKGMGEK